jgi:hypothetical protein
MLRLETERAAEHLSDLQALAVILKRSPSLIPLLTGTSDPRPLAPPGIPGRESGGTSESPRRGKQLSPGDTWPSASDETIGLP